LSDHTETETPRRTGQKKRPLIDWVPEGGLSDPDTILDRFTRWT
jgi:hypothetical protein